MKNKKAEELMAASVKWMSGGLNALEAVDVFPDDKLAVAQALTSGARCFRKAADLMDDAAGELRKAQKS